MFADTPRPAPRRRGAAPARAALAALVVAVHLFTATSAQADAVDKAVRDAAPEVMKFLRAQGYKNVGVLPFLVQRGNEPASLQAGPLNAALSAALRNALILLNDENAPIGILAAPAQEAAKAAPAKSPPTFATPTGRRTLLAGTYTLAWGGDKATPDALLTGKLLVSKDLKTAELLVEAFTKDRPVPVLRVARVDKIAADRNLLAGIGESFVVPRKSRTLKSKEEEEEAAAEDASSNRAARQTPLESAESPVKLDVFFDDEAMKTEPDPQAPGAGRLRLAAGARPDQKVKFVITNKSEERVGVILAVNGVNTLFKESLAERRPEECTKWVLAPKASCTVDGFYTSEKGDYLPFKVLDIDASAERAQALAGTSLGERLGVITLMVLRSGGAAAATQDGNLANSGGLAAKDNSDLNLGELRAKLQEATRIHVFENELVVNRNGKSRRLDEGGLLAEGEAAKSGEALSRVEFTNPQLWGTFEIRYYQSPVAAENKIP